MNFDLSPQQISLRDEVRSFAAGELATLLADNDAPNNFPKQAWLACANQGILDWRCAMNSSHDARSRLDTVIGLEALAYGCPDLSFVYGVSATTWSLQTALREFANADQIARYLEPLTTGRSMGAFAMSEIESGSDTATISTQATRDADYYVLEGAKAWVTFGPIADFAVVFASTNPDAGRWGLSAFIVDAKTPGFKQTAALTKTGLSTTPIGAFEFSGCRIHESQRLGAEGVGTSLFAKVMEGERGLILGFCLGAMERQLDASIAFAKNRKQFGQPIGNFQAVANRIVDMKTRLEIARLLTYKVATLQDAGNAAQTEAAMAKLYVGEAFVSSSLDAGRTFGARSFFDEFGFTNDLPDAIAGLTYGGTTDIQRMVISRLLGLGTDQQRNR